MAKQDTKTYPISRTVYAFQYMRAAAQKLSRSDRIPDPMMSCLASAFYIEAVMNHVGAEAVPYWDAVERIGPAEKLRVLDAHLELNIDRGLRPWQSISSLVKLRNALAHGKTRTVPANMTIRGTTFRCVIGASPTGTCR